MMVYSLTTLIFLFDVVVALGALALFLLKRRVAAAIVFGAVALLNVLLIVLFVLFWPM